MCKFLRCTGSNGIQMHALCSTYPNQNSDLLIIDQTTCISMGRGSSISDAVPMDIVVGRREATGGTMFMDEGILVISYKGDVYKLVSETLDLLDIKSEQINNDIIVNGKKIAGVCLFSNEIINAYSATIIVNTPLSKFDEYLKPTYKHDTQKVSDRVTSIAEYIPNITTNIVIEKILEVYKKYHPLCKEISKDEIMNTEEYKAKYALNSSELWIKYGLTEETAYGLDHLIINGKHVKPLYMRVVDENVLTISIELSDVSFIESLRTAVETFDIEVVYKHKVYDLYKSFSSNYKVTASESYSNCHHFTLTKT